MMADQLASQNANLLAEVQSLRQEVTELKQLIMDGFKMNSNVSPELSGDTSPKASVVSANYCKVCDKTCTNMSKHKQTNAHRRKEEEQRQTQIQIATNVQIACCGNIQMPQFGQSPHNLGEFQPQVIQAPATIYHERAEDLIETPADVDFEDYKQKCSVLKNIQNYWKNLPQDRRPILYHKGQWHVKQDGKWFQGEEAMEQLHAWCLAKTKEHKMALVNYNEQFQNGPQSERDMDNYVTFTQNFTADRNCLYSFKDPLNTKLLHRMVDCLTYEAKARGS